MSKERSTVETVQAQIQASERWVHETLDRHMSDRWFAVAKRGLDQFLPLMMVAILALVTFQYLIAVTPAVERVLTVGNWLVIGYFAVRLAVDFKLSDPGEPFLRQHWLEILMVIPVFTVLQEARFAKLLREMQLFAGLGDELVVASTLRNTGAAAKAVRIARIAKRFV